MSEAFTNLSASGTTSALAANAGNLFQASSMPSDSNRSPSHAPIPLRRRIDLVIRRQEDGRWVVKDPLSLSYSLLDDAEMCVLRSLDGRSSLESILQVLRNAWPERDLTIGDIRELIRQFQASQLVIGGHLARHQNITRPTGFGLLSKLSSILRIRLPLMNPDVYLERLRPLTAIVFRPSSVVVMAILVSIASLTILVRWSDFLKSLPTAADVISAENMLGIILSFVIVKAFHEFGHACAAKHFGAECNEAGIWLLLLTPVLYTNVTDAWLLERRQRMIVTAAGMLTEIVIASFAAIIWAFAAPGPLQTQLANLIVLCTVSTVLFNGNPLLRYDGYFLLTDALGIPNLAQRSSLRVRDTFERFMLGPDNSSTSTTSDASEHRGTQRMFIVSYGIASLFYRTLITCGILVLLMRMFDRWNLRVLGIGLMSFGMVSMVVTPFFQNAMAFLAAVASRPRPQRSAIRGALIAGAGLLLLLVPLPHSVILPAVVEPTGTPVFASLSGQLQQCAAYGTFLRRGDVVAILSEVQLDKQLLQLRSDVATRELQLRAMELSREPAVHSLIPESRKSLDVTRERLTQFEKEVERLTVRAASNGVLLPPRSRPLQSADDELPQWTGTPLLSENRGALIPEGTLLGFLDTSPIPPADIPQHDGENELPGRIELLLTLSDRDRQMIAPKQSVEFNLTGNPGMVLRGVVRQVASLQVSDVPAELIAAQLDTDGRSTASQKPVRRWQAVVDVVLPENVNSPVLYSTGLARVHIEPSSLAARLYELFQVTFR